MAYELESARIRIGLAGDDASKDAEITASMSAALSYAERYCDRKFMKSIESEQFFHFSQCEVQLHRYPIDSVGLVDIDNTEVKNYRIDAVHGRIVFDGRVSAKLLTIDYSGGYQTVPGDLEIALWRLFDAAWSIVSAAGEQGSFGAAIKSIASAGAKVEFDVSSSSSIGLNDSVATTILDFYKIESC